MIVFQVFFIIFAFGSLRATKSRYFYIIIAKVENGERRHAIYKLETG